MLSLKTSRRLLVTDLTRTRHMAAVSAVVLGSIFVPLVGGPIRGYEIAELRSAFAGASEAVVPSASAAPLAPPQRALASRSSDGELQTAALTDEAGIELTALTLPEAELAPALLGADELALAEPPEQEDSAGADDTQASVLPQLPAIEPESVEPNA